MTTIDFDASAERAEARADELAAWDAIDAEAPATTIEEMVREAEARADRTPAYIPSTPKAIAAGIDGSERRHWSISSGRLFIDAGRAVARFAPRYRREAARTLQAETAYLITRWPSHGGGRRSDGTHAPRLDLGGDRPMRIARARAMREPTRGRQVTRWMAEAEKVGAVGTLPRRADWILSEEEAREISPLAWRALHAAVKQASETREFLRAAEVDETETTDIDDYDFDQRAEDDARARAESVSRLPDIDAPEVLSGILGVTLTEARAMVARAFPGASRAELASQWGVSAEAVKKALDRGGDAIRARYPDPVDLLEAIDRAAEAWAIVREADAHASLIAHARGEIDAEAARFAVGAWREARRPLPDSTRALLSAARGAVARASAEDDARALGAAEAEDLARETARRARLLLGAEERRAERMATRGGLGSRTPSATTAPAMHGRPDRPRPLPAETAETAEARRWTYGLTARDDRGARLTELAEVVPAAPSAHERARRAEHEAERRARMDAWNGARRAEEEAYRRQRAWYLAGHSGKAPSA